MTLYVLGGVVLDTMPFNADQMQRSAGADLADKPVMGGLAPTEFMGEGQDQISLSGQLLPFKIGGLTELEMLDEMRRGGARFPVMRGDGKRLGTYAITHLSESHDHLMQGGVGFTVKYRVRLKKQPDDPGGVEGAALISTLLSVFEAIARA